jgi:hypothetical protein
MERAVKVLHIRVLSLEEQMENGFPQSAGLRMDYKSAFPKLLLEH